MQLLRDEIETKMIDMLECKIYLIEIGIARIARKLHHHVQSFLLEQFSQYPFEVELHQNILNNFLYQKFFSNLSIFF